MTKYVKRAGLCVPKKCAYSSLKTDKSTASVSAMSTRAMLQDHPACTHNGKEISENLTRRGAGFLLKHSGLRIERDLARGEDHAADLMPCEYEPSALGASGALIVVNDMVRIPSNDRRRFQTHSAQSHFGKIDKTFRPTVLEIVRANSRTPHRGTFKTTLRTRRRCRHAPRCK